MNTQQNQLKQCAAEAAIAYIQDAQDMQESFTIGIGSGSTVHYFIDALTKIKLRINAAVASSKDTEARLKAIGIPVIDLNAADDVLLYVDGADEISPDLALIKGGGGALTREKILAAASKQFICIADVSKKVPRLGHAFPLPIEVIPMARSFVARELVKLGGDPEYRQGFITDNGNIILDVYHLNMQTPMHLEETLDHIPGVVTNGLFTKRLPDIVLIASDAGIERLSEYKMTSKIR